MTHEQMRKIALRHIEQRIDLFNQNNKAFDYYMSADTLISFARDLELITLDEYVAFRSRLKL